MILCTDVSEALWIYQTRQAPDVLHDHGCGQNKAHFLLETFLKRIRKRELEVHQFVSAYQGHLDVPSPGSFLTQVVEVAFALVLPSVVLTLLGVAELTLVLP